MLIPRELLGYISRQVVTRLVPSVIETGSSQNVVEMVSNLITYEMEAEDRLNDEVREILNQVVTAEKQAQANLIRRHIERRRRGLIRPPRGNGRNAFAHEHCEADGGQPYCWCVSRNWRR